MTKFVPKNAAMSKNPRLLQSTFSPEIYWKTRKMRAEDARNKNMDLALSRQMNNENIYRYSRNGDLITQRSSMVSSRSKMLSHTSSNIKDNISKMARPSIQKPMGNFLQVPETRNAPQSLADKMEFILRKKTRLLEKQKTRILDIKNYKVMAPTLTSIWDIYQAKESDDSDEEMKSKLIHKKKKNIHKRREIKKMRIKYEDMLRKIKLMDKDIDKVLYRDHIFLNNIVDEPEIPSNQRIIEDYIKDFTVEDKIKQDIKNNGNSNI